MSIRKRTWSTKGGDKEAWIVDYKDQQGKRRLKTFPLKKDATAWWEGHAAHEIKQGTHTPESTSITVAEAGANWIKWAELEGLERSTVDRSKPSSSAHLIQLAPASATVMLVLSGVCVPCLISWTA